MSIEQAILEAVRALPPEQQNEILEHAQRLRQSSLRPRRNGKGLWSALAIPPLSAEEIDQVQEEAWRGFGRDEV